MIFAVKVVHTDDQTYFHEQILAICDNKETADALKKEVEQEYSEHKVYVQSIKINSILWD